MLLYLVNEVGLLLESGEREIISFDIGTIRRKDYMFIFYKKADALFMKYSQYDQMELVRFFVEEKEKEGLNSADKIVYRQRFIEAYRERFVHTVKVENPLMEAMIANVLDIDFDYPQNKIQGLDGYSVDCYIPEKDKSLHIWCQSRDEYFRPVIDLANALLDEMGVEEKRRFKIWV